MLDKTIAARISEEVDRDFECQIADTQRFAAIPSLRGSEGPAQDYVAGLLRERGYEVDDWTVQPGDLAGLPDYGPLERVPVGVRSVVGTLRPEGGAGGRSLIIQGHCDIVPAGPADMWSSPAFVPEIRDGWLYGRGVGDMKAGTISGIYAIEALRRAGLRLRERLHLQSVIEEESTGAGALAVLQRGYRADCALLPEPTGLAYNGICVGVVWFRLRVRGRPAHVASAGSGANAIKATYPLIKALEELEARWNERAAEHPDYRELKHPINFNPGIIKGGDWASSVPAWCDLDCRLAILPGWNLDDCRREIEDCLSQAASRHPFLAENPPQLEWSGFLSHGYRAAERPDIMQALENAHRTVTGQPLKHRISTGVNDARFYGNYFDIPAFCYGPLAENIHGLDERVGLDSIRAATKTIACFAAEWCGVDPR